MGYQSDVNVACSKIYLQYTLDNMKTVLNFTAVRYPGRQDPGHIPLCWGTTPHSMCPASGGDELEEGSGIRSNDMMIRLSIILLLRVVLRA